LKNQQGSYGAPSYGPPAYNPSGAGTSYSPASGLYNPYNELHLTLQLGQAKRFEIWRCKRRLQKILALLQHLKKWSEIITITIIFIMSSHQSCFETVFYYKNCNTYVWNKRVTLLLLWVIMIKVFSFIVTAITNCYSTEFPWYFQYNMFAISNLKSPICQMQAALIVFIIAAIVFVLFLLLVSFFINFKVQ